MVKRKQKRSRKSSPKNFAILASLISIFCLFIVISILTYSQNKTVSIQYYDQQGAAHNLTLTVKDKKKLTQLMQKLFSENSFAYTILGSKPVSWETYQNPFPFSNWKRFRSSFTKYNRILRSGWKTWEKYHHLFPSSHLWIENPKCHPGLTSILIINEARFNEVVNENKSDFQEVLGREITDGHRFIEEMTNSSLINEVLEGHQGLIGIVLGYGRDNSWQFLEGFKNQTAIGCIWGEEEDFIEEPETSNMNITDFYLSYYSCPSFAGNPNSQESIALKAEYLSTKQKVIEYYKDKDFLEATLSLLAGNRSLNN